MGPADDDDEVGDATVLASSCIASADPAVVDEHPATAAVTSTSPMVSSFMRVLISVPHYLKMEMPFIAMSVRRKVKASGPMIGRKIC